MSRLVSEVERLKAEGERDYKDMREFQAKFIASDREVERLKAELESQRKHFQRLYDKSETTRLFTCEDELRSLKLIADSYRAALEKIANYEAAEDDWNEELVDMYEIARQALANVSPISTQDENVSSKSKTSDMRGL